MQIKMEKRKALFIDRDGTINRDCPYCHKLEDLYIYDDAVELMKEYQKNGYIIIILTNQSGIGRGYFTIDEFWRFHNHLLKELEKRGVKIYATYFCPHRPEENCPCRKPNTGMIEKAVREHNIDVENSIVVGDRDDIDGEMARRFGIKYMIIKR
ncbi:MAG: HAD-IIIA family hydrolase [Euryarchaeota archaeon]|jgi:histidinol-phosphate phosphatase family protein|nr:HAD family hydrolase [Thermoplasmata archaeon]MVT13777.1 HAD-IIIA family hydrolase [Euryarchaeota archaeon]MVT14783.1 HAD-IIIA family hydrolase [Euryarchaeota archaeon]MVT36492.1 HAD-IIIA family hydrolase [Euryarchaeota archaeon]